MANKTRKTRADRKENLTRKGEVTKVKGSVRDAIVAEMNRRGWSAYRLAKAVKGHMTPQTVYSFIAGRSDLRTNLLPHLLKALDLEIRPKD